LFLFPSYQENCPLAPIEAAASGMPVIFRKLNEYELLYGADYLKANNTLEFVELTKRFIYDKSFYEEGLKISENLIHQFDKNIIREKLINLYHELGEC
jgi:1,2-diacylglycerol-3-alpha-glucose alpha-1,2-galactosyltransferase